MTKAAEVPEIRTTHILVAREMKDELEALAKRTRLFEAEILRDATSAMLRQYEHLQLPAPEWPTEWVGPMSVSLVFRLDAPVLVRVKALAARTRVRYSEWLRLAIHMALMDARAEEAA